MLHVGAHVNRAQSQGKKIRLSAIGCAQAAVLLQLLPLLARTSALRRFGRRLLVPAGINVIERAEIEELSATALIDRKRRAWQKHVTNA